MQKLLSYNGRPCLIVSSGRRRHKNPQWGWVTFSIIRYLDGEQPATEQVTSGKLVKAKAIRETEAIYWRRVDDLIHKGMEVSRAKAEARTELTKGLMTAAPF